MKTAMTFSIHSKYHAITTASYSIKYPTCEILFESSLPFVYRERVAYSPAFKVFCRVQFTLASPSWSTYSRVVDDGFPVSTKQRCVDSEKSHVKLNTFGRFSPLYFISHLVMYIMNSSPLDYESHTITVRRH